MSIPLPRSRSRPRPRPRARAIHILRTPDRFVARCDHTPTYRPAVTPDHRKRLVVSSSRHQPVSDPSGKPLTPERLRPGRPGADLHPARPVARACDCHARLGRRGRDRPIRYMGSVEARLVPGAGLPRGTRVALGRDRDRRQRGMTCGLGCTDMAAADCESRWRTGELRGCGTTPFDRKK